MLEVCLMPRTFKTPQTPPPAPASTRKAERLEARLTPDLKELLLRAAALEGRSLSDFVVDAAATAARNLIQEYEIIRLSRRDQEAFVKAMMNPPKANRKLKEAARWYLEQNKE
jgi:uncharacterized protein (DUF1778 family)